MTNDEETSGAIDVSDVMNYGKTWILINVQNHDTTSSLGFVGDVATSLIEGGQILLLQKK